MSSSKWAAAAALALLIASSGWADTVITKDGRKFTGEVTNSDGMVNVKTKMGLVPIEASNVEKIIPGDAPPAPAPVTSVTTPVPAGVASGAASKPAARPLDPKLVPTLLKQGQDALAAGEFPAARDAFSDAASVDPKNVTALHGKALALMYMGDFKHAVEPMEKALLVTPPDRALVINAAVMYIGDRLPMRAAKLLRDYLTTHQKDIDEPMLNALAVALNDCDVQTRRGEYFHQCEEFYTTYNSKLEDRVPGYKRWGVNWLTATDADAKNQAWDRALRTADLLGRELEYSDSSVVEAQKRVDDLQSVRHSDFMMDDAQRRLQDAQRMRDDQYTRYHQALDSAHGPEFPHAMAAVSIGDVTPPTPGPTPAQIAVLTAPPPPDPTVTTPKPHKVVIHRPPPSDPSNPANPANPANPTDPANPATPDTATPHTGSTGHNAKPEPPSEPAIVLAPKPKQRSTITSYAVAFPVTPDLVLTSAATVEGAEEVSMQSSDGTVIKGTVVRTDAGMGLGLVRLTDKKLNPLPLGNGMAAGLVLCASFPMANIFSPNAVSIAGTAVSAADGWKLKLPLNPRLPGGPVLAGGKVIGVEMTTRDADLTQVNCINLDQVLKFLGDDVTKTPGTNSDPLGTILQVTATRESK